MSQLCFLITAYRKPELCIKQIEMIRNEYKIYNDSPIVVVSTSETPEEFAFIEMYPNCYFIPFRDSPGNKDCHWFTSRDNGGKEYDGFRQKYLPARILLSMKKGIEYIYFEREYGGTSAFHDVKYMLHVHSDGYYPPEFEYRISEDIDKVKDKIALIDSWLHEKNPDGRYCAVGVHFLPENQMVNLDMAKKHGYIFEFDRVFNDAKFLSHDFRSTEALLGQSAYFSMTGKNANIKGEVLDKEFYDMFPIRQVRNHHTFGLETFLGFKNLPGIQ